MRQNHRASAPGRPTESWIDLTDQQPDPTSSTRSSSSASPQAPQPRRTTDGHPFRRRRLTISGTPLVLNLPRRPSSVDNSSQDEYDESESESDRVMTSSNEDVLYHSTLASQIRRGSTVLSDDDEQVDLEEDKEELSDDDDQHTALGITSTIHCFTPQPNAFSHPPSSMTRHNDPVPGSYFPSSNSRSAAQSSNRHSYPSDTRTRRSHTPYTALSPSASIDHDALLRDSLSTLLSCAAAARGLAKSRSQTRQERRAGVVDPSSIRMVPEAALLRPSAAAAATITSRSSSKGKGKRKSNGSRSSSKDRQQQQSQPSSKKARRASTGSADTLATVSPTLLTWFVAGGVVVLVSALSFSAGYVVGKEAGHLEAATGLGQSGGKVKGSLGLRRWGGGSVAAAVGA